MRLFEQISAAIVRGVEKVGDSAQRGGFWVLDHWYVGHYAVRRFCYTYTGGSFLSEWDLRWNTRNVIFDEEKDYKHYWSESVPGVAPCVESDLYQWTIRRWFGAPIRIWTLSVTIQVVLSQGIPLNFERRCVFASKDLAVAEFERLQGELRQQLEGSHKWPRPGVLKQTSRTPSVRDWTW